MDGDPTTKALSRIEAALARIEAAAASAAELASLRARHNRLRAAVQDSLGQLDALIEGAQG